MAYEVHYHMWEVYFSRPMKWSITNRYKYKEQ